MWCLHDDRKRHLNSEGSFVKGHVELLQPAELTTPLGQYSQVSRDPATGLVCLAGQVAIDATGNLVEPNGFAAQMSQVFENVDAGLRAAGASFATILRLNTYIVHIEDMDQFRSVRKEIYSRLCPEGNSPPHTLVVVKALSSPEHLIEVEAIAIADRTAEN